MESVERRLWDLLRVAGVAMQTRIISMEQDDRDGAISAGKEFFAVLRAIGELSAHLHLTLCRVYKIPDGLEHRVKIHSTIYEEEMVEYCASLEVFLVYDYSGPQSQWNVQRGNLDIDISNIEDTDEGYDDEPTGEVVVENSGDGQIKEGDQLPNVDDIAFLKKFGISFPED